VDAFNEPSSGYWKGDGKQEGANLPPAVQSKILPLLRAELDRQGLRDLPIAASDETNYKQALSTWHSLSPAARAVVDQVNVHGYQHRNGPRAELATAIVAEGKRLWNSEYGDKRADGLEMAHNLHLDFQLLHPTAWCYWQPLDTSLAWSFVQFDAASRRLLAVTPKLYVMAHYSRHLRPGMVLLDSSDPAIIAALDRAAGRLVVIVLNEGPARELRLDCSATGAVSGPVSGWLTEPRGKTRYQLQTSIALKDGRLTCPLPADSVQTFELSLSTPLIK
jgi:galactan endo-1,6-beta-galactosidase